MTEYERDRRIEALAAERVMGWPALHCTSDAAPPEEHRPCVQFGPGGPEAWKAMAAGGVLRPLTSIADAFTLLEAHPEWDWHADRIAPIEHADVELYPFTVSIFDTKADCAADDERAHTLCRAITYAALRAVGAGAELEALLSEPQS